MDRNVADAKQYVSALEETPLDYIYDTISEESTHKLAVDILSSADKTNSKNVVVVLPPNDAAKAHAESAGVSLSFVLGMGSSPQVRPISVPFFKALTGWLEQGKYVPNRTKLVQGGLAAVEQALEANKTASGVKIVIRPNDA